MFEIAIDMHIILPEHPAGTLKIAYPICQILWRRARAGCQGAEAWRAGKLKSGGAGLFAIKVSKVMTGYILYLVFHIVLFDSWVENSQQ